MDCCFRNFPGTRGTVEWETAQFPLNFLIGKAQTHIFRFHHSRARVC